MRTTLYIGEWRVDQFGDEAATVVSSVLDITDITKNTGDYTKTFTVPASKRNNILFKHWYDADIDNGFDARLKIDGRILLDGFPFKSGKWRLSKVAVKKNKPSSYTINFFGKLPSLKDIVKKDLLSDLDLSAYDHDYDSATVLTGLESGLFTQDIIYTLFAKKQYFYNSDPTNTDITGTLANIAWGDGSGLNGVVWNDLRASLRLLSIIEAIEEKYNGKQKTTVNVTTATTTGAGSCLLTLNGTEETIPISTTTTNGNALEIQVYVNALTDYTAALDPDNSAIVIITAVDTLPQENTSWLVGTSTNMETEVITTQKGNEGLVFSRDFFGTTEFTELYMWLNPSADKEPGGDIRVINWHTNTGAGYWMNVATDVGTYRIINEAGTSSDRYFEIDCIVTPVAGFENVVYNIIPIRDGEEMAMSPDFTGVNTYRTDLKPQGQTSGTDVLMQWKIKASQGFQYSATLGQREYNTANPTLPTRSEETFAGVDTIDSVFVVSEELPKLKILDFLKGLFNMFKLVVVPSQETNTYFLDTIDSYYADGSLYDVTKYVDFESYDVNRGEILNEIELKFKEPTTITNIQFEKNNQRGYGDIEKTLTDDGGELLDGESLTFELPFEQFVYERLPDLNTGVKSNVQYAAIIDEELEAASPSAHIFYKNFNTVNSSPVGFIDDVGAKNIISGNLWTPFHHYGIEQPNYASIFNNEFSTWDGVAINNNLYFNHYKDYIDSIFNIKKRTFVYEAVLPLHIITKLELNDVLEIRNDFYRIDKYNYNLLTGKTTLNLVNSFDNELNSGSLTPNNIFVDYRVQTETVILGNTLSAPTKIDQGFGTTWVTLTGSGNNLDIAFDENPTELGQSRVMFIQYTNGGGLQSIFLSQSDKGYIPNMNFSDSRNSQNIALITQRS
tara:strand:+ start:2299 stop:4998 length:2700 start_codon:yes stop_codon:yes gene_type:complete